MIFELNTDEFYAYGCQYEPWSYVNTEVRLKDEAEAGLLQEAARAILERMPYFKVKLAKEENPERLVLKTNDAPFEVYEQDGFLPLDHSDAREYLITITCWKKIVRIRFSHILSDGIGINRFITSLFLYYFHRKYGKIIEMSEMTGFTGEPVEEEYDNPFDYVKKVEHSYAKKEIETFSFSEKDVTDKDVRLTRMDIPLQDLLTYAKVNDTSVAAVAAWILMHAILAVNGEEHLPIGISLPFNMRGVLGCEKSMRNCNISLKLVLSDPLMKHEYAHQMTCLRGQMFAQTFEPCSMEKMEQSREDWLQACRKNTIEDRKEHYMSGDGLSMLPIVSYMGTVDLGEYGQYYEDITQYLTVSGTAGILMMILCEKGTLHFNITSTLKEWDLYLDSITDFLEKIGLPFTVVNQKTL